MGSPTGKLTLHRRGLELDGERFSVLALRPSTAARYATTELNETWTILCDPAGAGLLGRLSWAMAFQSRPHTVLLIDLPLIAPDPFAAGPPAPILMVNTDIGAPSPAAVDALRAKLPLSEPSEGSVRLTTAGYDRAIADPDRFWTQARTDDAAFAAHLHARWVERVHGVVVLAAPAPVLRQWAIRVADLASRGPLDASWVPSDATRWTGEVQVLASAPA